MDMNQLIQKFSKLAIFLKHFVAPTDNYKINLKSHQSEI